VLGVTPESPDRRAADAAINTDADENRALAVHILAALQSAQATGMEAIVSISKWLLTSLLAINGAAAIATWQVSIDPRFKIAACGLFLLGVLTTLISGHLGISRSSKSLHKLGEHIGYWMTVQVDGLRASDLESFDELQATANSAGRVPVALGWLAMALFVAGAVVAGFGAVATTSAV
jgi:hypothetical protein